MFVANSARSLPRLAGVWVVGFFFFLIYLIIALVMPATCWLAQMR